MDIQLGAPPPTPAATVVVVRDGAQGIEVLMLCRQQALEVHGGVYVFPGGKVESGDRLGGGVVGRETADELCQALGEPGLAPADAVALHVAAVRETYEEAGILLGGSSCADVCTWIARGESFAQIVRRCAGGLQLSNLAPWSRWITPAGSFTSSRRFDTRFFVCAAPDGQMARHDLSESSESLWVAPREALGRYGSGEIKLMPPQILTLNHLSTFPDVGSLMAAARARRPYVVRPMPVEEGGRKLVVYPGDELHAEREPVMPGPTRLVFRDGRYELAPAG
ncbi:NUDIX hydrolase [Ramlibacter tataouinensis]|uniref:NUDIX hydrolase n=1 Tax=Ramlibacter tataouinensis TaxID=94132 RepID=UPI0022F3B120|nr:NUDIX hydrolase [Ramlibacter tataouinensis]WBY01075.1 NUDIX hydrolase [Ramlibacter tataouinensis]